MSEDARATYRRRRDRFGEEARNRTGEAARISRIRGFLFLLGVGLLTAGEMTGGRVSFALLGGGALALSAFGVAVVRHRRIRKEADELRARASLNSRALDRIARRWEALPEAGGPGPDPEHSYDADLGVSGERSFLALCTDVATRPGGETLRRWLLEPAPPDEIERRQEAVAELTPGIDFREELALRGAGDEEPSPGSLERTIAWAEEEPWEPPPWLHGASWLLPPVSLGLLVAHLGGWLDAPWWALPLGVAWALLRSRGGELAAATAGIGTRAEAIGRYGHLLELIRRPVGEADLLREVREAVDPQDRGAPGEHDAPAELRSLRRAVAWAEVRQNDLLHLPLQLFLLWDVHVVRILNRWRRRTGHRLRGWVEALGTIEALSALATLRADHPGWCFPDVDRGADRIEAEALGHPLLPEQECVPNDVTVGPAGTFLFVTGSNMAGKSTLLRAVGINAVLAQAGGPVCARTLRLPPVEVHTAMRVQESLSEGISYFMAELRRIRGIVDAARASGAGTGAGTGVGVESPARALYLLDEPLQGTNEAERRVAIRTILGHLLRTPALGAVATHDLRLHTTDLLDRAAQPVHLEGRVREGEEGPVLTFDYRVRPGLATSTNALALLRAVGLGEEDGRG